MAYGVKLHVWGEYACFTRPEMKVERVSYDVMTPSAARGILEAIHWKPAIRWAIDRIHVLKPIRFENLRRNELGGKNPAGNVHKAMRIDAEEVKRIAVPTSAGGSRCDRRGRRPASGTGCAGCGS